MPEPWDQPIVATQTCCNPTGINRGAYDGCVPEAFGQFSETIARTLGTARFLVFQTVFIGLWIIINRIREFDGKQLQLLTLLLSLQAAYAAPLILLAQNRQEQRDRLQAELDRNVAERTQVDTEFLARELAGVRLGLADVASSSELEDHLERLTKAVERLGDRLGRLEERTESSAD